MKKVLLLSLSVVLLIAVSCSPVLLPPSGPSKPALTLYSVGSGGIAEAGSGTESIRNVSFVLTGKGVLKLDRAPDNAVCSYVSAQTQIYCRLGDMLPGVKVSALYTGQAASGKLAYIGTAGEVTVVDAELK